MDKEKFTNRPIDKLSMKKSKEYLWKFIESKTLTKAKEADEVIEKNPNFFINFFRSLSPKKLIPVGVVAVLLIAALLLTNLRGLFEGGLFKTETVHASFEMLANEEDASGVETDSSFTLTSSEDYSEEVIAENLKVTPEVEFEVDKTGQGEYEINPKVDLEGHKIYNFVIISTVRNEATGQDKKVEYSWAYQITDTFKITGTLPDDKTTGVPVNSGIEINFSHEGFDFDKAEDYFEISPAVRGTFGKHRDILSFVPSGGLKEATLYTVKIKKGLKLLDSDKELKEDYLFQFETDLENRIYNDGFGFMQKYYEVSTTSTVALESYGERGNKEFDVEVYKYPNVESYIKALGEFHKIPSWSYLAKDLFEYDSSGLTKFGDFQALVSQKGWKSYIYFPSQEFLEGYYLFQVKNAYGYEQALVQVTDLSAYLNVTATDTIVWVNDLKTGQAVPNAKVQIGGEGKTFATDAEGISKFGTPEEWKITYQNYQDQIFTFLKITEDDGKQLILEVNSSSYVEPADKYWLSFYTDRPVYKPTDKVQFFGFIKGKTASDSAKNLKLKMKYNWDEFVKEMPIALEKDGTFIGNFELKNYLPGYYYLDLIQGEQIIYTLAIEISDYVKPAYNLTVEADKKAVFAGDNLDITMKAAFFEGTPVPNLTITSYKDGDFKTDSEGGVKISKKAPKNDMDCGWEYCYDIHDFYYDVYSKLGEEADITASTNVRVFDSRLYIGANSETVKKGDGLKGRVEISTNLIDLSKINNGEEESYYDFLGKAAPNQLIKGEIKEFYWEKVEIGEYYDFIEKLVKKEYKYQRRENVLPSFTVTTDENGKATYELPINATSYYWINLKSVDQFGNDTHANTIVYGNETRSSDYVIYVMKVLNGEKPKTGSAYWWETPAAAFDIGDEVQTAFSRGEIPIIASKGKFLFLQQTNGLLDYEVNDSSKYDFKFSKNHIPNVNIFGVWFTGQKYETTEWNPAVVGYKSELEKLNIKVETDKESYKPGAEVKLSVKVTDQNNRPAMAKVNFNLVDEAYYKIIYDSFIGPLEEIYAYVSSGQLQSYGSHNNPLMDDQGGGEGKGGCFTGETQILMSDGTTKAIKDIEKGDMVLTKRDEFSLELVPARVEATVSHFVSGYMVINENLEVTPEHIVFVNGKWQNAGKIQLGDTMSGKNGEEIRIVSIRRVVEPVWVYNFVVEDKHTYFANGFYVHNNKGDGGPVRTEFEDVALFKVIETDTNGYGELRFKLPDNITSWRTITKAIDAEHLRAGHEISSIKVTLPFFADLVMNDEYSVKDEPEIKFRAYGNELKEDTKVEYEVSGSWGNLQKAQNVEGEAFENTYFKLPKLELGKQQVILTADAGKSEDGLAKSIEVKGSRLRENVVETIAEVNEKTVFDLAKDGPTQIKFLDAGAAAYYSKLWELYYEESGRLDKKLGMIAAAELLNKYFKENIEISKNLVEDLLTTHQREKGLSLLPYSSPDLKMTALLVAMDPHPERYSSKALSDYFYEVLRKKDSNLGEVTLSLLGLASLHEPVLLNLQMIKNEEDLSLRDKLYIALAFQNLGSNKEAAEIYEKIFKQLREGDVDIAAMGAVLAAGLQEEEAAKLLWEYVKLKANPEEDSLSIYEIGYFKNSLEYANYKPVSFKVKFNDKTEKVTLEPWETYSLISYSKDEVAVSVTEGMVGAILKYSKTIDPEQFERNESLSIDRVYLVNGQATNTFSEGDIVKVQISVNSSSKSADPIFSITDILPSGLKPITTSIGAFTYSNGYYSSYYSYPYSVNGQELKFAWYPWHDSSLTRNSKITYYARVVSPGKYYADPAKIEHFNNLGMANIADVAEVEIMGVPSQIKKLP